MLKFECLPDIARVEDKYNPVVHKTWYSHDYGRIFRDIAEGRLDERGALRSLFVNDLWFLVWDGSREGTSSVCGRDGEGIGDGASEYDVRCLGSRAL